MTTGTLRTVSDDLKIASDALDLHVAELRAAHALADDRIDVASAGLPGGAAAALAFKAEEWQDATTSFARQLDRHAASLRQSGSAYELSDDASATALSNEMFYGQRVAV